MGMAVSLDSSAKLERSTKISSAEPTQLCHPQPPSAKHFNFTAPDGGYGWVVVIAACMANTCINGFFKSYTVFYATIREAFPDSSAYHASWIPSLFAGLSLFTAPVAGALCQRFNSRSVVITGGCLCFCGLFLASFATSLNHLLVTLGLLTGLGGGFVTAPSILIVNKYFDKRRAFASGICMSGNAFGGFIIPPVVEFLLQEYGFRGTLVIMAAIQLNLVVAGFCFRPTTLHAIVQEKYRRKMIRDMLPMEEISNEVYLLEKKIDKRGSISSFGLDLEVKDLALSGDTINARSSPGRVQNFGPGEPHCRHYSQETDTDSESESSVHSVSDLKLSIDENLHDEIYIDKVIEAEPKSQSGAIEGRAERSALLMKSASETEIKKRLTDIHENELTMDSLTRNDHSLMYSRSHGTLEILRDNNENNYKDDRSVYCESPRQEKKSRTSNVFNFIKKFFGTCFDFEVLRTTPMILMSMSGFLVKMGIPHTLFYLHALFISIGADSAIVTPVISATSALDVVSRLGIGILADTQVVPARYLYFSSCALAGACIVCIPFATTTASFAAAMIGYCLGTGSWTVLLPTILARNHGSDKLPASLGFVKMLMGVSNFVSPQISGALVDLTGSYATCYYFMGTSVMLASFLPLLSRDRRQGRKGGEAKSGRREEEG
ncbi:Major facilitator superfamily [Trinorchestia longiramus]|nr:Major facilitator superfamily [Trinorchestia longiramus]